VVNSSYEPAPINPDSFIDSPKKVRALHNAVLNLVPVQRWSFTFEKTPDLDWGYYAQVNAA
jgi:hypothetical protein